MMFNYHTITNVLACVHGSFFYRLISYVQSKQVSMSLHFNRIMSFVAKETGIIIEQESLNPPPYKCGKFLSFVHVQ